MQSCMNVHNVQINDMIRKSSRNLTWPMITTGIVLARLGSQRHASLEPSPGVVLVCDNILKCVTRSKRFDMRLCKFHHARAASSDVSKF